MHKLRNKLSGSLVLQIFTLALDLSAHFYAFWNKLRNESNLPYLGGYTNKGPYLTSEYGEGCILAQEAESRAPDTNISPTKEVENEKPARNQEALPSVQILALRPTHASLRAGSNSKFENKLIKIRPFPHNAPPSPSAIFIDRKFFVSLVGFRQEPRF